MLHELIALLKSINECEGLEYKPYLTDEVDNITCVDMERVDELACGLLITNDGRCNWVMHRELERHGFPVRAGDKDSFGWLTGCIHTKKGVIVYG